MFCGKIVTAQNDEISVGFAVRSGLHGRFDRLVALQSGLIEELDDVATVDGHFGSGEFNIFVLTDDPATVFVKAHRIVINEGAPNVMRSAYREMDGENYVILGPSSLTEFSIL
jgi:hypothetical protein